MLRLLLLLLFPLKFRHPHASSRVLYIVIHVPYVPLGKATRPRPTAAFHRVPVKRIFLRFLNPNWLNHVPSRSPPLSSSHRATQRTVPGIGRVEQRANVAGAMILMNQMNKKKSSKKRYLKKVKNDLHKNNKNILTVISQNPYFQFSFCRFYIFNTCIGTRKNQYVSYKTNTSIDN